MTTPPPAQREPHRYDVTWTMYLVPVWLPKGLDPDSEEAKSWASEAAAEKLRELGPDSEDVECVEEPGA